MFDKATQNIIRKLKVSKHQSDRDLYKQYEKEYLKLLLYEKERKTTSNDT